MNIKEFCLSWGMLLIGSIMNVFGVYVIKMKINTLGGFQFNSLGGVFDYFLALMRFPLVIIGAIFVLIVPLPYAIALSKMELSVAYPLSVAFNCLIILPLAAIFLGESITLSKLVAVGLILVSLYFLYK